MTWGTEVNLSLKQDMIL